MGNYALIKDGTVVNTVSWDGTGDIFEEYTAVNIDDITCGIGWGYDGSEFAAPSVPALSKDELIENAVTNKTILINQANDYINSKQWPSRLALGRLSDEDKSTFNEWLDYLDALNAIDTSAAPDITWPEQP